MGQKVAIVHDWLVGGGAEKVVEQLHNMYPQAPIYTAYCSDEWRKKFNDRVVTGYLQNWPFSWFRKYLPVLMSNWFRSLNLQEYDTILVSSGNGTANHIQKPEQAKMVFYCHTPTHYLWDKHDEYLSNPGFGILNPVVRVGLSGFLETLQERDLKGAQQADVIIANSTHTKEQIQKYYSQTSKVIFPPVNIERFKTSTKKHRRGFVIVGRQVPYKRFDLAVTACNELKLPLTVIGDGPEHQKLRALAGDTITFIKNAADKDVEQALHEAEGYIFTSEEDFGISPVEALAAGCPVIAYKAGGALDYVKPGTNGLFFEEQTVSSLKQVLTSFDDKYYSSSKISSSADRFSEQTFKKHMEKVMKAI